VPCIDTPYTIGPPAGWRDDQAASRKISPPARAYNDRTGRWEVPQLRIPQPVDGDDWNLWDDDYTHDSCTPSRYRSRTARQQISPRDRLDEEAARRTIVYAQYDPSFDPDLQPLPQRSVVPPQAARPAPADDDGELPPGMTPAAWLAQRHVMNVARKAVADPAAISYVPAEESEEPQLVVTPAGFRYAARFEHLEIRR
jgi:hypothetical protein